ncbi:MAG: alpha/beta hydrolase [Acutalibacteraceae bacterium]|nr:alpha/beta hydrolase [Acutalibacteraceae bacterium]
MEALIRNLKINYEEKGSGEPVLMLHGWGSSLVPFTNIINLLSSKYRVIAPDFPGCGKSETMAEAWNIDDYCDFVLEFCEKLDIKNPILIGHSHGGRVIMKLVGEKKINPVKVIFLDSAGLIPKKSFKTKMRIATYKFVKKTLSLPVIRSFSGSLLDRAKKHFGSTDYRSAPPVLQKTLVNVVNVDLRHLLCNFECPTLLIWGENDTATPLSDAKIIESLVKDSGLCVIKGAGHFAFLDNAVQTAAILKSFLKIEV